MEPNFRESPELGAPFGPEARKESGGVGVPKHTLREAPSPAEIERERAKIKETGAVHHEVHESHPLPVEIETGEQQKKELEKIIASGGVEINPNKEGKHPADVTDQLIEMKDWTKK